MKAASLPQLIADEIRTCLGDESEQRHPEDVIAAVTKALAKRTGVKTQPNWAWALRCCVRMLYRDHRNGQRSRASDIEARRKAQGAQPILPGWAELQKWRITSDDGLEVSAAYATLVQIEGAARDYAKLASANATKGQHLVALADAMRQAGMRSDQTVEEFFKGLAQSA